MIIIYGNGIMLVDGKMFRLKEGLIFFVVLGVKVWIDSFGGLEVYMVVVV